MIDLYDYILESFYDNKLLKPLRDFIQRNFKKKVGFKENIKISIQGDTYQFSATMDTGNGGIVPTLGVDKMIVDNDKVIITIANKEYTFDKKGEASPTVGNVIHHRPIIIIDYIEIRKRRLNEPFIAVTDERKKSTKSLINRDTMSKLNLIVDPGKNSLISEKLKLNKDIKIKNKSSKYTEAYKVSEGDIVLCICYEGKDGRGEHTVSLHTVKIYDIDNDFVNVINTRPGGRRFDKINFYFEDYTKSTTSVPNSFALYHIPGFKWAALIKKDRAISLINRELTPAPYRKKNHFNGYKLLNGINGEKLLKEIKEELENN